VLWEQRVGSPDRTEPRRQPPPFTLPFRISVAVGQHARRDGSGGDRPPGVRPKKRLFAVRMVRANADYVTETLTDSEDGDSVDLNPNLLATVSAPRE
jgi:hypothetical protein